jgi:hypothetical protein
MVRKLLDPEGHPETEEERLLRLIHHQNGTGATEVAPYLRKHLKTLEQRGEIVYRDGKWYEVPPGQ